MKIEYKTFPLEMKVAEDTGKIEGHAAAFNNVDFGDDKCLPGCFEKTISEQRGGVIPILADHVPSWQIGWNKKATEDEYGLRVSGILDVAVNQKAKEKHSLAKLGLELGAKVGLSIGYNAVKIDWETASDGRRIRLLKEVRLWEYSLVTFPMNDQALVTGAKNWLKGDSLDASIEQLIAAFSEKGYSQSQILSALASRAATRKNEPDANELHSVLQQIETLTSRIAAA